MRSRNGGFTLIELLTVLSLIGILGAMGLTSFKVNRQDAAYVVVEDTLAKARSSLEAGLIRDEAHPAVALYMQAAGGIPTTPATRALLDGMVVPESVKFRFSHDPLCTTGNCQADFIQVNHCRGSRYSQWLQFGDGLTLHVRNIPGAGCP